MRQGINTSFSRLLPQQQLLSGGSFYAELGWEAFASDNKKMVIGNGRLILNPNYRRSKMHLTHTLAMLWGVGVRPLDQPCWMEVIAYRPDARRRDVMNFRKILADCLEKAGVVKDDTLIRDERWHSVAIDKTNPRLCIHLGLL